MELPLLSSEDSKALAKSQIMKNSALKGRLQVKPKLIVINISFMQVLRSQTSESE